MDTLCPKCEVKLPSRLSSGRVVCSKCGWSDSPRKIEESNPDLGYQFLGKVKSFLGTDKPRSPKSLPRRKVVHSGSSREALGGLTLLAGLWMMFCGLSYDTSVSAGEYSFRRIVNEGRVSERAALINTGGFLTVCGTIFITSGRSCAVNSKREEARIQREEAAQDKGEY
jgi:hypothetical protein